MSTIPPSNPHRPATCPRCAYDLAGAVARWNDSCDLHAICPECGLDFPWRDVMNPTHIMPRWFFENPVRSDFLTLLLTLPRLLRPRRFWSAIRLSLPIHIRRLVALVVLLTLLSHMMIAVCAAIAFWNTARVYARGGFSAISPPPLTQSYLPILLWPYSTREIDCTLTGLMLYTRSNGTTTAIPLSTRTVPVIARSPAGSEMLCLILPMVLMPLSYLLLGETLRRTRVRPLHLFRIFAYSVCLLVPALLFYLFVPEFSRNTNWLLPSALPQWLSRLRSFAPAIQLATVLLLVLLGVWWHAATVRYLRLPHATGIVMAMLVITTLTVGVFAALTQGYQFFFLD